MKLQKQCNKNTGKIIGDSVKSFVTNSEVSFTSTFQMSHGSSGMDWVVDYGLINGKDLVYIECTYILNYKFVLWNVRTLFGPGPFDELRLECFKYNFDILAL